MELKDALEFRYADGRVVTREYEYTGRRHHQGDRLEEDGTDWEMYDREDRGGATVYLFRPAP
jgi:hypothetical protein